jgi:hypothetical protein
MALRRPCLANLLVRQIAPLRRGPAPRYRHWRHLRHGRAGSRGRCRLVLRHDAGERVDPEHPDRRRLHGLADASRIARRSSGCAGGRGGRRRQDRSRRDARARHAVRPPRHSPNGGRQRLCRSVVVASAEGDPGSSAAGVGWHGVGASAGFRTAGSGAGRHGVGATAGFRATGACAAGARRSAAGGRASGRAAGARRPAACTRRSAAGRASGRAAGARRVAPCARRSAHGRASGRARAGVGAGAGAHARGRSRPRAGPAVALRGSASPGTDTACDPLARRRARPSGARRRSAATTWPSVASGARVARAPQVAVSSPAARSGGRGTSGRAAVCVDAPRRPGIRGSPAGPFVFRAPARSLRQRERPGDAVGEARARACRRARCRPGLRSPPKAFAPGTYH